MAVRPGGQEALSTGDLGLDGGTLLRLDAPGLCADELLVLFRQQGASVPVDRAILTRLMVEDGRLGARDDHASRILDKPLLRFR